MFVVSGPSGVGKGTLVARLRRWRPDLWWSVSVTTRAPRAGEVPGVDYHFVSDPEFDAMVGRGELLEWAEIYGHRSGTPRAAVESALAAGRTALLELDVQGARSVRSLMPEAVLVFVAPPSLEVLRERLQRRGSESAAALAARLQRAAAELEAATEFDHVVVNDDVERAFAEIAAIISGSG